MRIAVCDNQQVFIDQTMDLLRQELGTDSHDTLSSFSSGEALWAAHQQQGFDLIFLDIELGSGWNGMETAQRLRQLEQETMIVFLTSYAQYKDDAFDVSAAQYLMKPVEKERFLEVFRRCRKRYFEHNYELVLTVYQERLGNQKAQNWSRQQEASAAMLLVLPMRELLYAESFTSYLLLHTTDGTIYRTNTRLNELAQQLQDYGAVLVHKSILVNLRYIRRVEKGHAVLAAKNQPEQMVEVSRRRQKELEKLVMRYKLGRVE